MNVYVCATSMCERLGWWRGGDHLKMSDGNEPQASFEGCNRFCIHLAQTLSAVCERERNMAVGRCVVLGILQCQRPSRYGQDGAVIILDDSSLRSVADI